ncbi:putative Type I secretion system membrane fusion protein PrsE [uncultured Defluviicoccus sp.]|uniref:Putative Type I secretion system membrane fusion protein PrsE n=1 Tax=metagenome TaxID=256318 RepID=A0A380TE47_9ZZZZ|nr:putative Type I secretion system membrane fusion protein PrsE [uncultured Defluviicoccus sp.]
MMSALALTQDHASLQRRAVADDLTRPATQAVRHSGRIALGLFVALLVLAIFVPIASGALANGQITVDGERKVVQHATGGIVSAILVKEGDTVNEGDVVVRLNAVQAGAAAGVINSQVDSLRAEEAVRIAETTGESVVDFPADLVVRGSDPAIGSILKAEQAAFSARRALARSQAEQLDQQLVQIEQSIIAANSDKDAQTAQAALFEEELGSLKPLLEKGLALKPRVLALERSLEDARGRIASSDAEAKRLAAKALETRAVRNRIEVDRRADAAEALRKLRADLAEATDKQAATDDTLQRTEVRAPISGVVMAVRVTTIGGVVEPGQPILEIVPKSDQLVARVRIHPKDADDVRQGMEATIRLMASGSRSPAHVEGYVQSISADALTDQRTGEPYFEARVSIPADQIAKVKADVLAPGLPAEVLIKTGEHTTLDYLLAPIERAAFQSMRD